MPNKFIGDNLILDSRGKISWKQNIGNTFSIIYDNQEYSFQITKYDQNKHIIYFLYDNIEYNMTISNLHKCRIGKIIGKYLVSHKYSVGDIVNGNMILGCTTVKDNMNRNVKAYNVKCLKDGYERIVMETSLNAGCRCPICTNKKIIVGINDLWTTHPKIASLLKDKNNGYCHTFGSGKYLLWECPNCKNTVKARIPDVIYNNGKLRCNQCSDGFSYPEKLMVNILRYLNIDFKHHIKLENKGFMFKNKVYIPEYDFFITIKNRKILVEMDGNFHNKPHIRSSITINDIKYIDSQKDKLAIENGYEIIRIDCAVSDYDYIISSLRKSELNNLIDLNSLNKSEINSKAYSSLLVESCNLYMTKTKNLNTISKIMDIPYKRIQVYLSKGAKIGLCDYDPAFSMKNKGNLDFIGTYWVVL